MGQLDIQGEERNILPVTPEGAKPVDIELATSLYTPKTAAIYISWGAIPVFVETAPVAPAEPAFVSPTEVPKPVGDAESETAAPSASDIVPPSEVAPAQSPPGTR